MQKTPYPYIFNLGAQFRSSSLEQLAALFTVNQHYRHQAPHQYAETSHSRPISAAKLNLQKLQNTLNERANPFAFDGQKYQVLPDSPAGNPMDSLIAQISSRGFTQSPYNNPQTKNYTSKSSGSRHVVVDIDFLGGTVQVERKGSEFLSTPTQNGQVFRLHYYQDSRQEIILLKDISARKAEHDTPYRGLLNSYSNRLSRLGLNSPLPYGSGTFASSALSPSSQTTILTRKIGKNRFQTLTHGEERSEAVQEINTIIDQNFARFRKIKKIQEFTDSVLQANSAFVIVPTRSSLNAEKIKKNNQNLIDFYPGLRQGFSINNSDTDIIAAGKLIGDHYRAKYSSHTSEIDGATRYSAQRAGINSELYQDYSALISSRDNAASLARILESPSGQVRNQHLMHNGQLLFGHLETTLSNDQDAIARPARFREDTFQSEDSLVSGHISLLDVRKSYAPKPGGELPKPAEMLNYSLTNNLAQSSLSSLMLLDGSADIEEIMRKAKNRLQGHSDKTYYDQASLSGNIDVSSVMLQGLKGAGGLQSNNSKFVIDLSHLGNLSSRKVNINWQLGAA